MVALVDRLRSDQAIVSQLLDSVSGITSDTGNHEDRRIKIDRNIEKVIGVGGWEVDVWIEVLLVQHDLLKDVSDIAESGVSLSTTDLFRNLRHIEGSAVTLLVLAMAEAHDLLFGGERVSNPSFSFLRSIDLQNHVHRFFVGSAVERATQSSNSRDDAAVEVAQRAQRRRG